MNNLQKIAGIVAGVLFILLNCFALYKGFVFIPALSFLLIGFYFLFFKIDLVLYFLAFSTPLSILISDDKINLGLSIPGEIIMILLMGLFFVRLFMDIIIDKKIVFHPITLAIFGYLAWLLLTSITSELPLVSFKFFLSKVWFIVSCYFMVIFLAKNNTEKWKIFMNCYLAGLAIVICYATIKLAMAGFPKKGVHWAMSPFYNDHTAYGAAIALFIPLIIGFFVSKGKSKLAQFLLLAAIALLIIGLYFSYCRAAWLSIVFIFGIFVVLYFRIRFSWIIIGAAFLGFTFYSFSDEIMYRLGRNSQDSSANISEHLESITNISTDASNVERLNRWVSAFGMIEERPIFGWGPGTYQFIYASYQKPKYKTIITTNFGDGGNAHSEYIGPTAETGFIGLASVLILLITIIYTGLKTYFNAQKREHKILSLSATLALISYYFHGIMNNFLDTDKLSLPFWACVAIIVIINLRVSEERESQKL